MLAAAAAAAAAEAAARDAAETEAQQGGDAVLSVAMSAMAGDEVDAAATLGQDPYGHEHQLGGYEAANGMVVEPVSEVGMDHLLQQMVAEQQQVEREQQFREQLAAAAVAEAARLNRPQEHFITIASNGELPFCPASYSRTSPMCFIVVILLLPQLVRALKFLVAVTGTILGITETATGFPPNNLLMTSV